MRDMTTKPLLMKQDEDIAGKLDTERFAAEETARKQEVHQVIETAQTQ